MKKKKKNEIKKHLYMLDQAQTAKLLANAKQLVRKNCLLFEKSGNFLHRANLQDERTF